ncbi:MAG: trypsin-like peptidase domain-containing protein [Bdellovibrionales bacterium]|nr:trypsin-like peptidase domain-containing protein [Bdellovibrionales bacterium]
MKKAVFTGTLLGVVGLCQMASARAPAGIKDFPDLVAKVSPAVVNIQTTKLTENSSLKNYLTSAGAPAEPVEASLSALGSGFVVAASSKSQAQVDAKGRPMRNVLIITNNHVIDGADEIEIMISRSSEHFLAKVAAIDPRTDIAVLRATLPADIEALTFADSAKLRVGETVFAIGNPYGLGHTVTAGILSAKDRSLGVSRTDRYLQTDAAINPGNSGGPLFNMRGEVVGINTLVRVDAQGIGFAIPSNTVTHLLPQLEAGKHIEHSWLGLVAVNETTALRNRYGLVSFNGERGVVVTQLVKNGPAHRLSVQEGDVIHGVNVGTSYKPVNSTWDLRDALEELPPGTPVELRLQRGQKKFAGKLTLESAPSDARLPEGHDYY